MFNIELRLQLNEMKSKMDERMLPKRPERHIQNNRIFQD